MNEHPSWIVDHMRQPVTCPTNVAIPKPQFQQICKINLPHLPADAALVASALATADI